ncbi:MAG: hypothetical protein ACYCT1_02135 [Steroidobacteraceae bacterium]
MPPIVGRIAATVREDSGRVIGHRGGIIRRLKTTKKKNSANAKTTRLSDTVFVRPFANWIVIIERSSSWKND